ncbi:MAG: O-antigen biosynthesis protein WlbD [Rubricoccaceae bacterium]
MKASAGNTDLSVQDDVRQRVESMRQTYFRPPPSMTVLTVVGARPQFIKAAAVSRVIAAADTVDELLVHTGQHYDPSLSDVFFDELEIPAPSHHLGIGSGSHGAQTGQMLAGIEEVLLETQPDWVLVYGDTNSTLAGALAAAKLHIPIAHVEAGLRSFNRRMPEEINRVLTDHASTLLFTPTETADRHLAAEGIPSARIRRVGDVMYDVARFFGAKAERESQILRQLDLEPEGYVLATVHRAENTDDPERLQVIFDALGELNADTPVILPLHPRTRAVLDRTDQMDWASERVRFVAPVGYLDMMQLEQHARLVATDSGGVQKEAYFAGTPCVTLRDETEWTELVDLGWNRIAPPTDVASVTAQFQAALQSGPGAEATPYGDGTSAERIVEALQAA